MSPVPPGAWQTYRRLLAYARPYRMFLAAAAIGMVLEAASAGLFARLMEPMVNQTFVARDPTVRWSLPLAILGLFVLRGVATFVTDYGMARAGRSVVRDLRTIVLAKFLRLPSARFDREPVAAMVSRLNYDTEQVTQATSEALKVVITDTLTIMVLLGVMLYQSVRVTMAMLIIAPLIAGISAYVGARYRRINRGIQSGVANMAQAAEEVLSAQQEVKIYGAQQLEIERYQALAQSNLRLNIKVESTRASASSLVQWLAACALAVILVIAGQEAMAGRMSAGSFVSIMMAMMALIPSLKRITNIQSAVQKGIAAAERLFAVLDEADEKRCRQHAARTRPWRDRIRRCQRPLRQPGHSGPEQHQFSRLARHGDGDRRPIRQRQVDVDPAGSQVLRAQRRQGAARRPAAGGLPPAGPAPTGGPGRATGHAVR